MPPSRRMLEDVLAAYRDSDWHECVRRVRPLVESAPLADGPRQLLASLYLRLGNRRLALPQYRRLLAAAVERGQLLRAIAFQRRVDLLDASAADPRRWTDLQTRLRTHGLPYLSVVPIGSARPWTEAQILALPREWFERAATESTLIVMGLAPGTVDTEANTLWEVIVGRTRWSLAFPDGRAGPESIAAEGDAIRLDPDLARRATISFLPELPTECMRFDAGLVAALRGVIRTRGHAIAADGLTAETRALLPTRPQRQEDIDRTPEPVPEAGEGPRRLALGAPASPASLHRDAGEWLEHGMLSLDSPSGGAPPPAAPGATEPPPRERTVDLPAGDTRPAPRRGRPVVELPGPVELDHGLIIPPVPDPFAAPIPDLGKPVERRRGSRVGVSFASRLAMLRLAAPRLAPAEGTLTDLSTTGLGVRFPGASLGARRGALAGAVVAIDLDLPDGQTPLRVAGQVRWIEVDDAAGEVRFGIEFVLLTEPDRRRIAGALAAVPTGSPGSTG